MYLMSRSVNSWCLYNQFILWYWQRGESTIKTHTKYPKTNKQAQPTSVCFTSPVLLSRPFFRSRDQDWDLGHQVLIPRPRQNELESRDNGTEITTLHFTGARGEPSRNAAIYCYITALISLFNSLPASELHRIKPSSAGTENIISIHACTHTHTCAHSQTRQPVNRSSSANHFFHNSTENNVNLTRQAS